MMSFLNMQSCEGAKSELDIFSVPPTQTSIESGEWIHYKPIAALTDDGPLEFVLPGAGLEYYDLSHTYLYVVVKLVKLDGSELDVGAEIAPSNNFLSTLFSQVDVSLNGKLVSQPNNLFPYRCYIETLLTYNETAKNTHLTSCLWYSDDSGKFEDKSNSGYIIRKKFTEKSKPLDLMGRLHTDIFNMDRHLINGVEVRIKLSRSKASFCLIGESSDSKIIISNATLMTRKVKINPRVTIAHAKVMESNTAKYPISRVDVKAVTIAKDTQSKEIDNLFMGQLPERLIIGLVSNTAVNGSFTTNPFLFHHYDLSYLSLYVDGHQIPSRPLQPIFTSGKELSLRSYMSLFTGTGIHDSDDGNCISRTDYAEGYCLYAFDLTADLSAGCKHWSLQKQGTVRLEIHFGSTLKNTLTCIVYSEFKNIIEIDKFRNVITDFAR